MPSEYLAVAVFAVVGTGFAIVALIMSRLVRKGCPNAGKLSTYECGERPAGEAWTRFRAGFYIYALIFVIFEVETVFMFPAFMKLQALDRMGLGLVALLDILLFLLILLAGLVYAWKKGVLKRG